MRKISSMKKKLAATGLAFALVVSGTAMPGQQASAAAVKKVTVSKKSVTLYDGATEDYSQVKLTASVNPKKAAKVKWSSSKKSVATVTKSGLVKAKKPGKAVITAKAGAKKATCKVTVKAVKKITKVTVKSKNVTIKKGKTSKINATVSPKNATLKKLTYSSANKKIATVSANGVIKGIKAGKTKITVRTVDGSKKTAAVSVTVKASASSKPSAKPTTKPTTNPTSNPTSNPSSEPSASASASPSVSPSASPSVSPSASASASASVSPSASATTSPTGGNSGDGPSTPTMNPGVTNSPAPTDGTNTVTGGVIEVSNADGSAVEGEKDTTKLTIKYILKSDKSYKINVAGREYKVDSVVFTVLNKLDLSKWGTMSNGQSTYKEGNVTVSVDKTSATAADLTVAGYSEADLNGEYTLKVEEASGKYTVELQKKNTTSSVNIVAAQSADKSKITVSSMKVVDGGNTETIVESPKEIVLEKSTDGYTLTMPLK